MTPGASALIRPADACLARPRVTLLTGLLVAVLFASGLPRLDLRTDGRAIYPSRNPVVRQSAADAERFREPDQVILLISARPGGPPVASPAGLRFLDDVDRHLRTLPVLEASKVRSLASLLEPEPGLSALQLVREYLAEVPATPAEVAALRARVRRHPLGEGLFLSADGSAAAAYAHVAQGVPRREAVEALEEWIRPRAGAAFDLRLTGPAVVEVLLGRKVLRDLAWTIPIMVLVMALLLYACLGTPGAVAAVMAEVLVVLVCVLGAMGHAGVPVTLVTTVLPVVVMVLAVADEVHFLERLQAFQAETADTSRAGRRAGAEAALREMGRPMVLTSLTTAAGFLAFPASDIAPLRDFGIFAAGGILLAMLSSFTLIPALVVTLPASWWRPARPRPSSGAGSSLSPFYTWVWRHEGAAFAFGLGLVAALLPGCLLLSIQDSWIDNFDRASPVAVADRLYNARFWGTYRFDVVLESPEPRFFKRAAGVRLAGEVARAAAAAPHAAGVVSHLTPLQVLAELTGRPGDVARLPPEDLRTVTALATLLGSSLDLDHYLSRDARAARVRILVKDADYRRGAELREHLERRLGPLLRRRGVRFHWSGDLPIALAVVRAILTDQLGSIGWSLAGIGLVLLLVLRRPAHVAVVLVPVVAAAGLVLGAVGYLGLPLGIATSMFLALSVGSGTDFSLHFFHAYREARAAGADHAAAVGRMLATAGRAVRWNAVVLGLGFLVLTLSSLPPNRTLGLLLASAMLAAYLTTVLLFPRLLRLQGSVVLRPQEQEGGGSLPRGALQPGVRGPDAGDLPDGRRGAHGLLRVHQDRAGGRRRRDDPGAAGKALGAVQAGPPRRQEGGVRESGARLPEADRLRAAGRRLAGRPHRGRQAGAERRVRDAADPLRRRQPRQLLAEVGRSGPRRRAVQQPHGHRPVPGRLRRAHAAVRRHQQPPGPLLHLERHVRRQVGRGGGRARPVPLPPGGRGQPPRRGGHRRLRQPPHPGHRRVGRQPARAAG